MTNIIITTFLVVTIIFIMIKLIDFIKLSDTGTLFQKSLDDIFVTSELKKKLYNEFSSLINKIDIDYKDIDKIKYRIYLADDWQDNTKDNKFLENHKIIWSSYDKSELKYRFLHNKFQDSILNRCSLLQEELVTRKFKEKLTKSYIVLSKDIDKYILFSYEMDDSVYSKIKRRSTKILNAGLINSFIQKTAKSVSKDEVEETTIIGMMIGKKIKKDTRAYVLLFSGLIIHLLFSIFITQNYLLGTMFFVLALLALQVNQKIMEYRIRKGYYGSNYYEAREIVQFIVENADDDFYSGGKIKKFMPDPETIQEEVSCVEGGIYA